MIFIADLFPQAAGSPSVPPPPRALFEDFFSSSVPPLPPIFLNWFERILSALADADPHLASFVALGRGDYLFLLSRSSTYAVMRILHSVVRLLLTLLFFLSSSGISSRRIMWV